MAMTSWDTILNRLPEDSTSFRFRLGLPRRSSRSLTLGSAEASGLAPACRVCMSVSALVPAESPSGDAGAIVLIMPKLASTHAPCRQGLLDGAVNSSGHSLCFSRHYICCNL